jgi:hypothetical protein
MPCHYDPHESQWSSRACPMGKIYFTSQDLAAERGCGEDRAEEEGSLWKCVCISIGPSLNFAWECLPQGRRELLCDGSAPVMLTTTTSTRANSYSRFKTDHVWIDVSISGEFKNCAWGVSRRISKYDNWVYLISLDFWLRIKLLFFLFFSSIWGFNYARYFSRSRQPCISTTERIWWLMNIEIYWLILWFTIWRQRSVPY